MSSIYQADIGGRPLIIETGRLAAQANGAATVAFGETVVLVTVCATPQPRDIDFFPLTIDHPAGTMKVAPPGVARGVSLVSRSGADRAWPTCGDRARGTADAAMDAKAARARNVGRTIREAVARRVNIGILRRVCEKTDQQYTPATGS